MVRSVPILASVLFLFLSANRVLAGPVDLRCEHLYQPLGIDAPAPRFSWRSDSTERDWVQSAYEVLVASKPELLAQGAADIWDSGRVLSDSSVGVVYGGPPLQSRTRYFWTVKVWDAKGSASFAPATWWETGLLRDSSWGAQWISWRNPGESADRALIQWIWMPKSVVKGTPVETEVRFQRSFALVTRPVRAAIFLTAQSDFQLKVNGSDVASKSGWMSFDRQEIGYLLRPGTNTVEVSVKTREPRQWDPNRAEKLGKPPLLAGLLKIELPDGTVLRMGTDDHWEVRTAKESAFASAAVATEAESKRFGKLPEGLPEPAAMLRREFDLTKNVKSARLYLTALGSYLFYINGKRVGEDVLTPGFTDYRKRVLYQTYDVTTLLKSGKNAVGALLGDGWFASAFTWDGSHVFSGPDRLLAQLEVEYSNGTHEQIVTDSSWKAKSSPILHSEIYAGETYDARLNEAGWNDVSFDDAKWSAVAVLPPPEQLRVGYQPDAPATVVKTLPARTVTALSGNTYVFDMGQNMVGWAKLKVNGPAGTTVRLRFAEVLNPDGSIYRENLRGADATDMYILRGGEREEFEPHFTFHGFRYVEITGYPGTPSLDAIEGRVVSSLRGEGSGKLTTSSDLVNRMWSIGIWGQRGNFVTIPTDCPQRDERLGWMGDAAAFWRTGSYNFDIAAFSEKWLEDIRDAQMDNGAFTNVVPDILSGQEQNGAPGWGDAGVIVPYTTWLQYGDTRVIEEHWEAMERWMRFIEGANPDYLRKNALGPNYADWLAPDQNTPSDLVATAYWALIAQRMEEMARATGKSEAAKRYLTLQGRIRSAYQRAYVKSDGTVAGGTQTAYVLTLAMKLAPKEWETAMVENLTRDIDRRGGHLSTGFLGTPFLLFALSDYGRPDVAYKLLLTESYPSWGYMLSKGATTWWERWNGDTGDPTMNSYNHYAFGSVVAWVYRRVAGIDTVPDGAGFHEIVIRPVIDDRITEARGEYDSVYGKIVSEWSGTKKSFNLKVRIPGNTSALIYPPAAGANVVMLDGKRVQPGADGSVNVGAGEWSFTVN